MKKICVVTGSRSEYGILIPLLKRIEAHPDMKLQIEICGMHIDDVFGATSESVISDFPSAEHVWALPISDAPEQMGIAICEIGNKLHWKLKHFKPDFLIIFGDRMEAFAAAIAGIHSGAVVCHIQGGDRTQGGYDEYYRHAITKLAHLHFPATEKSARRIFQMGENGSFIWIVGCLSIDGLLEIEDKKPDIPQPYVVLLHHPVSTKPQKAQEEFSIAWTEACKYAHKIVCVYPNNDAGGRSIIETIEKSPGAFDFVFKNLPRPDFINLLRHSEGLVGNSSAGVIECPYLNVPFYEVGDRQKGRERGKVYGDGHTAERIVDVLANFKITPDIFKKQFVD